MSVESVISDNIPLKAVMNTVLDGLIIIDSRGMIQDFNPAAGRIFGYTPEEVIGENVKMLMPDPYHREHDGYISNYHRTRDPKVIGKGREVRARRKDGSIFPMELGVNEMRQGSELYFVGTIRDISAQKEAQEKIHESLKSLTHSNQELDDFAYIASHDLKEPLRGLSNNAIFLKEDYGDQLDAGGVKRLNRISFLCERMERLVDDLLYFSRLGRQELAVQEADLNEIVEDIKLMMESMLTEEHVQIVIPKGLNPVVCDVPRVTELLRNLITNAIKYNKSEAKVVEIGQVEASGCSQEGVDAEDSVFYVKDNGIGIDPEFYEDVFRIFKRLNAEDDSVKGTGVGLTFVKKIVERHGGVIWIEPNEPTGTVFYFSIPQRKGVHGE